MRLKKTKKTPAAAKTARPTNSSRSRSTTRPRGAAALYRAIGTGPIVAAATCIVVFVGAIALVPSRDASSQPPSAATEHSEGVSELSGADSQASSGRQVADNTNKRNKKPAPAAAAADAKATAADTTPSSESPRDAAPEAAPKPAATDPITTAPVEKVASVTITGCLEHDEQAFWLKDTSGDDAPTARSWKSGFLRKRTTRIELVDPHNSLKLPAYVGRRIAATGTLVNREMQPRSLHPLGVSCS